MANMDAAPQVILHTSMGDITVEVLTYYSFSFPLSKMLSVLFAGFVA
jgi:hypothetical protein